MFLDKRQPSVSIIVPAYKEAENISALIVRIEKLICQSEIKAELIIVDDNSQDGTEALVAQLGKKWVKLIIRREKRDLSRAVLRGIEQAQNEICVVMDADLSHPPEAIPQMVTCLKGGCDFVVGSRYVRGGSTDAEWGLFRFLNSYFATLLARPLIKVKDPMSGFLCFWRKIYQETGNLNPIGYKIGLELLVKSGCKKVCEIPIHFKERELGKSKLSLKVQLQYLRHVYELFVYKYKNFAYFTLFSLVGASGVLVNLAILTLLLWAGIPVRVALVLAILISMISNFILNRHFTFFHSRHKKVIPQLQGFLLVSFLGACLNYLVALWLLDIVPGLFPQVAALGGIAVAAVFNFILSRYWVFR